MPLSVNGDAAVVAALEGAGMCWFGRIGAALLLFGAVAGCGEAGEPGEPGEPGRVGVNGPDGGGGETAVVTTSLEGIAEVRLAAGAAEVDVRSGGAAEIRQEVETRGGDPDRSRHQVDGSTLRLPDCGRNCSVRYTVTLPEPVPVTGELISGRLDVDGMRNVDVTGTSGQLAVHRVGGPVRVRSTSGRIELSGIGGAVDVRSTSGQVTGEGIAAGEVVAELRTGQVELELTAPRNVRVDTGTGSIDLRVPPGAYRVEARAGTGSRRIDVPQDPMSDRELELSTGTGSIRVGQG